MRKTVKIKSGNKKSMIDLLTNLLAVTIKSKASLKVSSFYFQKVTSEKKCNSLSHCSSFSLAYWPFAMQKLSLVLVFQIRIPNTISEQGFPFLH